MKKNKRRKRKTKIQVIQEIIAKGTAKKILEKHNKKLQSRSIGKSLEKLVKSIESNVKQLKSLLVKKPQKQQPSKKQWKPSSTNLTTIETLPLNLHHILIPLKKR